jgi:hypothetical protein
MAYNWEVGGREELSRQVRREALGEKTTIKDIEEWGRERGYRNRMFNRGVYLLLFGGFGLVVNRIRLSQKAKAENPLVR